MFKKPKQKKYVSNDDIKNFKRELSSMKYFEKKIKECEDDLTMIGRLLYEAKTIHYGDMKNGRFDLLEKMDEEDRLVHVRDAYLTLYKNCLRFFESINDKRLSRIIYDLYVNDDNHEKVALDNNMSRSKMYRDINKAIINFLRKK